MHETDNAANIIDRRVVEAPELLGKECIGCFRILAYNFYRRDHSFRDGRRDMCTNCEAAPRLSIAENTAMLREQNYNSHAVRAQRWAKQETWNNEAARRGKPLPHGEFLRRLRKIVAGQLYVTEGGIVGDLAVYRVYPQPQARLDGKSYEYLFYIPTGTLPEFSLIEFDQRDVPVKEKRRGWRTVLLRLIQAEVITEQLADKEFGVAEGEASYNYRRQLHEWRNREQKSF